MKELVGAGKFKRKSIGFYLPKVLDKSFGGIDAESLLLVLLFDAGKSVKFSYWLFGSDTLTRVRSLIRWSNIVSIFAPSMISNLAITNTFFS
jgi:hypothetical protein